MDNLFGKFNVFDFFNLILSGAIFIIGLQFVGIKIHNFIISNCGLLEISKSENLNLLNLILYIVIVLAICYIIGGCMQEIGTFFQKKVFRVYEKSISTFLNDSSIVDNEIKYMVYRNEANKLFKLKGIKARKDKFSVEQNKYFFSYCVYYIQIRGQHEKTEKLREISGLSNILSTCFAILFIIGCGGWIYQMISGINDLQILITIIIFAMLAIVFWFRMKKIILYRIRMVLCIYEACIDMDD